MLLSSKRPLAVGILALTLTASPVETQAAPPPEPLRPTVAVLPPLPADGKADAAWIGVALADDLSNRLLLHSRLDGMALQQSYPLNVFGWRQVAAAARSEGIDIHTPVDTNDIARLGQELGTDALWVASYTSDGTRAVLSWRLVPVGGASVRATTQKVTLTLDQIALAAEAIADEVIKAVGETPEHPSGQKTTVIPMAAAKPFGEAVALLAGQSLDPRARLVLSRADIERAHALLATATRTAPDFSRAWVESALASSLLGNAEAAEAELVQALAQSGELEPSVSVGLFHLYDRQGKADDARRALEEAVQAHRGFLQGQAYLGSAYLHAARPRDALTIFTKLAATTPKSPWARVMRATALARLGEHAQAIRETEAVQRAYPQSLAVTLALSERQIDAHELEAAHKTLAAALVRHAHHPVVLTRLSYVNIQRGDFAAAVDLAGRAVAALGDGRGDSLAGYAQLNLGHALARVGRTDEAYAALRKAATLGIHGDDLKLLLGDAALKAFLADPRSPLRP
ncbi:MAG: tetratricopeptide repeat protein [Myxococcota bacterium]